MSATFSLFWVEDDPNDLLLGERAILKAGFPKPEVARDGEQAIEYLSGLGEYADRARYPLPGLILLDLKLPRLSGFEVLRWIREREGLRRIPVVMLTSSRERRDIDRAYDCGASAYLVKPVETQAFSELVRSLYAFWVIWNTAPEVPVHMVRR